jgi:hypothetical protein
MLLIILKVSPLAKVTKLLLPKELLKFFHSDKQHDTLLINNIFKF